MTSKISFFGMKTTLLVLFLLFMAQNAHAQSSGTFTVYKDYVTDRLTPNPVAPVSIRLLCTSTGGGPINILENPMDASPGNPAVFNVISRDPIVGCTATEDVVPVGYTVDDSDCQDNDPLIGDPPTGSCTIVNMLNRDTFTVTKTFEDLSDDFVTVTASCTGGGTFFENPVAASPSIPAIFTYYGYTGDPTCTALESDVPPGYSADSEDCQDNDLLGTGCEIANTYNIGTFTVNKTYNDGSDTPVLAKVSCTGGGTFLQNPKLVVPGTPTVFDYEGFSGTPTCTALERNTPIGYWTNTTDCQDGDPLEGSCTLANGILVNLDNNDRLGDAGLFQYYTVNGGWQTFIRVVNNSDQVVSVKVSFREAANSREVLDFIVFLSPFDIWAGWTDRNATNIGQPGVRTLDTSCLYPRVDSNVSDEGWKRIGGELKGANFQDRAFTDIYDDGGNLHHTSLERMSEGHLEIIGIAQHDPYSDFGRAVTHNHSTGVPPDCTQASNLWEAFTGGAQGNDLSNVLGMNGYVINVALGQGGGYDPDMLANFQDHSLVFDTLLTATDPDMDTASAGFLEDPRTKQKGLLGQQPVTGGVDAVSYEFTRKSLMSEWAASYNPENLVSDYYSQWLVTFPTKHYYVDLQDDVFASDDISPTLVERPGSNAYAPFYEEFDEPVGSSTEGKSCEPFRMRIWNREESFEQYSSPAPVFASELCNETNVVVFNQFYTDKGLNSAFSLTIPEGLLPTESDGSTASERGWASMDFYGELGLEYDVSGRTIWDRGGLPVTGWLFSIFNTNDNATNHTTINAHKYTRETVNQGPPVIISDGGGDTATVNVLENTTFVTDVESIDFNDEEGNGLTYTLTGGADVAKFTIDPDTGDLSFLVAPDFDAPTDVGADNVYDVQVTVTDSGPGTPLTDVQDIAVMVLPVNESPVITSDGGGDVANVDVPENTTYVTTVTATDPDVPAQTLTYSIYDGDDLALFSIDPVTGELTFNDAPDHEIPTDSYPPALDNEYEVWVKVTDSGIPNHLDVQQILVTVTDVNENPVITSDGGGDTAAVSAEENQTAVTTVTAIDEDVDPVQTLTFWISGGADAATFTIDGASGVLTFIAAPNFEIPTDAGADNVYDVQVTVTDSGIPPLSDVQDIAVTVTDVNETPIIVSSDTAETPENSTPVIIRVDATDVDADCGDPDADCTGIQELRFTITGGADAALFELVNPTTESPWSVELKFIDPQDFESPANANALINNVYEVEVTATDIFDPGPAPLSVAQLIFVTVTDVNEEPEITSDATVGVDENTIFVIDVTADDVDADCGGTTFKCTGVQTLAFSVLPGKDGGLFHFPTAPDTDTPWSQQLQFKLPPPNFENPGDLGNNNVYEVDVLVTDVGLPGPAPLTDMQTITVTVLDVNEDPVIISDGGGEIANIVMREETTLVTTVEATDEDADCGQASTDSCGGEQKLVFSIIPQLGTDWELFEFQAPPDEDSPWSQQLQFIDAPSFENGTGSVAPNTYWLYVQVTDLGNPQADGLTDQQLIYVEVIDRNDFVPHIVAPAKVSSAPDIAEVRVETGTTAVTRVHAIDIDSPIQTLTYQLADGVIPTGGPDGGLFFIDPISGDLSFLVAPVFVPAGNNIYEVYVLARDNGVSPSEDSEPLVIFVEVVENLLGFAPIITSDGGGDTADVGVETGATAVTLVEAFDANVPPQSLSFSISGGADMAFFQLGTEVPNVSIELEFAAPSVVQVPPYEVEVTVCDNSQTVAPLFATNLCDSQLITVTVADPNLPPVITGGSAIEGSATPAMTLWIAENITQVVDLDATDPNVPPLGQTPTWSISDGVDRALFRIHPVNGQLEFFTPPAAVADAPDFENPTDDDRDNNYQVQVTVCDDGATTPPLSPTNLCDVQDIIVKVNDVNEWPMIIPDDNGAGVSKVVREGETFVTMIEAIDDDADCGGQPATASCTGEQKLVFEIIPQLGSDWELFEFQTPPDEDSPWSAQLQFIAAPNFENPADIGGDNVYELAVRVTDLGAPFLDGLSDAQRIRVFVIDQNDFAPQIVAPAKISSSPGMPDIAEVWVPNLTTTAVTTVHAIDIDSPIQTITYHLADGGPFLLPTGGPDGSQFTIDPISGDLSFNVAPQFNAPTDLGSPQPLDNIYEVYVVARDNGVPVSQDSEPMVIFVEVVENQAPVIVSPDTFSLPFLGPILAHSVQITAIDPDVPPSAQTLTWSLIASDPNVLSVNITNGALRFVVALPGTFQFEVMVCDNGGLSGGAVPPLSPDDLCDTQELTVEVLDPNTPVGSISADILEGVNRGVESPAGNLIADVQLWATGSNGAQIAFMNPGGIRSDLIYQESAGEGDGVVTIREAWAMQPFGNILVTFPMTGAQIISVLEDQCQPFGLQHLGVSDGFTYDRSTTSLGLACTSIAVSNVRLNGVPLNPATTYMVTTSDFLADGGDNFDTFGTIDPSTRIYGDIDLDALSNYLATFGPVDPPDTDRVNELPIIVVLQNSPYVGPRDLDVNDDNFDYSGVFPDPGLTVEIHGNDNPNIIVGWSGKNIIYGYGGNDNLTGGDEADEIYGGDETCTGSYCNLNGLLGDTINGGGGADFINGGNETCTSATLGCNNTGKMGDTINGGNGVDTIIGGNESCTGDNCSIAGEIGDTIDGGAANDIIDGGDESCDGANCANFSIVGDVIAGGTGADIINGGDESCTGNFCDSPAANIGDAIYQNNIANDDDGNGDIIDGEGGWDICRTAAGDLVFCEQVIF